MASEIRVNKIENRSGLGTVTFADTGVDLAGIVTATTFSGSGASLTALPSAQLSGALPAISAASLTNVPAANVVGVHTSLTVTNATTTGTVVVGGGVTISESGIEASGIGITCANINGTQIGGRRNIIINGAMNVAQRGTSFNQAADGSYTLDRFAAFRNGAGIMDIEQSTTVPSGEGFKKSLKCTVDTADSSLGGADFGGLFYKIEGQDINRFEFGSSSAKQFTLSFFVRSNITGTYSVAFRNGSANRYLVKEYTISSADTWQKITITDTADLTGTWASDNTTGLQINWCLWEGGFTAAPNTWGSNNIIGSTNNVNWVETVGNTFYLTGVQLELGSQATAFEHRSFAEERLLCKRYYHQLPATDTQGSVGGYLFLSKPAYYESESYYFPVEMRAAPTMTTSNTWILRAYGAGSNTAATEVINSRVERFYVTSSASNTNTSYVWILGADSNTPLKIDAEL